MKISFLSKFSTVDWHGNFCGSTDVSQMFDTSLLKVSDIINRHLPPRLLSRKEAKFQTKPWITQALKIQLIKEKQFI